MDQYNSYYSLLKSKIDFVQQVKKQYSKTLASEFNSLDFWNIGENKVSEILCFLLNPSASHGQGDAFLKLFIRKFDLNFSYTHIKDVFAKVEEGTDDNRRIDIFLINKLTGSVLAIENKIYYNTRDQLNQISDYLKYLKTITIKSQFTFIYLAPKGKVVSPNSFNESDAQKIDVKDRILFLNYEDHFIPLIHQFALTAENERVRAFIHDFERKLKQLYMGKNDINETQVIKNFILESSSNLDLSFHILNNMNAVKADLREKFTGQMIEIGNELNIHFDLKHGRFYLDKLGDNTVGFSFEGGGLLYGIVRKTDSKDERVFPKIELLFHDKILRSYWWPMHFWLFRNIESNIEFWEAVQNGKAKEKIISFITTLINCDLNNGQEF